MKFHFRIIEGTTDRTSLVFAKIDRIFLLNYITQQITTIYEFRNPLYKQPLFFSTNAAQTTCFVASPEDGIYWNSKRGEEGEIDIDYEHNISAIKEVAYDPETNYFYVLCNKYAEKLGFFILMMCADNPTEDSRFLMKLKNKFDIGDANMFINTDPVKGVKELVISAKTIYINTYDIKVLDISSATE